MNVVHGLLFAVCCLVQGHVQTSSGAPVASAHITVRSSAESQNAVSDARGDFALHVAPGSYVLSANARGFAPISVSLDADRDVRVQVSLEPLDSPKLRVIGEVTVDGRLAPVRGAIPSIDVTRADLERTGSDRVVEGLQELPGATFSHPDGGAGNAISVVSLRGPDPSESLVALDGQLLNDANTGDLDLSQFPVAAFSSVNVTEGLGPQDANGSNTFGGAIDFVSLRPTASAHEAYSLSAGAFGESEAWANATGTNGRLGYAFAADDRNEAGYVNQTVPLFSSTDPSCAPCATPLGSSVASHLGLGSLTWTLSQRADVTARVFLLGDMRDQSASVNGIDGTPGSPTYGEFIGPGVQTFAQTIRAYQVRSRSPLGSGELTSELSESDNSVALGGSGVSPYDVTHADRRYNGALTWQRAFERLQFAVGGYTRYESLSFIAPPASAGTLPPSLQEPHLGQTIDVLFARGGVQAAPKLRLDAGLFESHYTSFGSNLDGRFGAIYDAGRRTTLRFSLGTGFRAPLLIERYAFPLEQLAQDANGVFVGQGSPDERPEHATEYELGMSQQFRTSTLDVSLYRTNLRDPIEVYYPLALAASGACMNQTPAQPVPGCVSYTSNVGNAVYQGAEVRYVQRFAPGHVYVTASYGLNIAYPQNLTADFSNPTSAGNLANGRQFLGIPQQQGSIEADWSNDAWHAGAALTFRGNNNELFTGPFAVLDALVGRRIGSNLDLSLAGTNLTNAAAGRFTVFGGGVPYLGAGDVPLATNALHLEPAAVRAILTLRR